MTTKGENITSAFRSIRKFYCEVAQMFMKLDELMEKEGWESARGNTTTSDVSKDLQKPKKWLPEASFRVYENTKDPNTRKGINVYYVDDDLDEPILIIASIDYSNISEEKLWDITNLYFDQNKVLYKEYSENNPSNKWISAGIIQHAKIYALNLVDISNEEDIKNKLFKRLIEM